MRTITDKKLDSLVVREGESVEAPALTTAGWVHVDQGATLNAPALTWVESTVHIGQGGTLNAPALTTGGYVYIGQGGTLNAPKLRREGKK